MANDDEEDYEDDNEEDDEGEGKEGGRSKKKLFLIIGIVLILVICGVAGAYFSVFFDSFIGSETKTENTTGVLENETTEDAEPIFKDFPDILTNLNQGRRKKVGVRIKIVLQLSNSEDLLRIDPLLPRVHDEILVFIRKQYSVDLAGAAGMQRVREELLTRLNKALSPSRIRDIYIKEMLLN